MGLTSSGLAAERLSHPGPGHHLLLPDLIVTDVEVP